MNENIQNFLESIYQINNSAVNLKINDNKQMSNHFSYKYNKFLIIHKSTPINEKDDLIKLLKRKPRSNLTGVKILVSQIKRYGYQLERRLLRSHPNNLIRSLKINKENKENKINHKKINNQIILNNRLNPVMLQEAKLKLKRLNKIHKFIQTKVNSIKNSLINNKLTFPVYLLNSIVKNKPNYEIDLTKLTKYLYTILNITALDRRSIWKKQKYILNNVPNNINHIINSYNKKKIISFKSYLPKIDHFKKLIKKYNLDNFNNFNHLTNTKYFQLITKYKFINKFQQIISYNFNKNNNIKLENIINLLESCFRSMSCLISKPVFLETPQKLVINLFYFYVLGKVNKVKKKTRLKKLALSGNYHPVLRITKLGSIIIPGPEPIPYRKKIMLERKKAKLLRKKIPLKILFSPKNIDKINKLCTILSRVFNKTVELDLIPLKLPFFDDNILVKAISIICNKIPVRTIFNFIFRKTALYSKFRAHLRYKYSMTKSFLAGINIKIGGRLMTQRVIPRKSSREIQRGAISHRKVNFVDWSRTILKNKRGAHSITVTMSHVI